MAINRVIVAIVVTGLTHVPQLTIVGLRWSPCNPAFTRIRRRRGDHRKTLHFSPRWFYRSDNPRCHTGRWPSSLCHARPPQSRYHPSPVMPADGSSASWHFLQAQALAGAGIKIEVGIQHQRRAGIIFPDLPCPTDRNSPPSTGLHSPV